ncbi:hypothetical protein M3Y97_01043600 [Aphelenchoides bicaudatus]|nr:hypothetical protein M3Y97_01043600 [Aphelenchoides bicaudatus]
MARQLKAALLAGTFATVRASCGDLDQRWAATGDDTSKARLFAEAYGLHVGKTGWSLLTPTNTLWLLLGIVVGMLLLGIILLIVSCVRSCCGGNNNSGNGGNGGCNGGNGPAHIHNNYRN